jgi:hypothetical protein
MDRRDFLKFSTLGVLLTPLRRLLGGPLEHAENIKIWKENLFKQETVDSSKARDGIIRGMVDGKWQKYEIRTLPDAFLKWNLNERLSNLDRMMKGEMSRLAGPHSGMIASYGIGRKDSRFTLNNAVKGFGFAPEEEFIDEKLKYMKDTFEDTAEKKMSFLIDIYKNPEVFNKKIQTSLELYTTPEFETHSFLNLIQNPQGTIVFLDNPSYEIRTIVRVIHPKDKTADSYERKIVEYTNLIHSYFHGKFSKKFIGLICYVIEVFDNSPGKKEAMGRRIV